MKKLINEQLAITRTNPIKARLYDYPRFTYPWHFHSEYEFIFIEKGRGQCLAGDSIADYSEGDGILFGSNLPHCMQTLPEDAADERFRVQGAIIQFEKDFMQYSFSHYIQFNSIRNLLEEAQQGICFPLKEHADIARTVRLIPHTEGVEQVIHILTLLQALSALPRKRLIASPNYSPAASSFSDKKVGKVIAYLSKRYTQDVSLPEIASFVAMSPASFCRYFKANTGKTLTRFIHEMRIGYACKLLSSDTMNVSQISAVCGYDSITPFNRHFKEITGMTPTQYKEKVR